MWEGVIGLLGILFVASLLGVLIRFGITLGMGALTAAVAESEPLAIVAGIITILAGISAIGSFVLALIEFFSS